MNILPSFNHSISNKDYRIDNTTTGCSSDIYFSNTSYTLSFGHLFSGNLHCYQSFNPLHQCYESCSFELPEIYSNSLKMVNIQSEQDTIINHKVNEAMKTIPKTIKNVEKQCNYSIPSVPYCYNSIISDCNQNEITKAAILLERAAYKISGLK